MAIKVTQCKHGDREHCDCEMGTGSWAISEESDPAAGTDSSRYLAAGAQRAFWVRTRRGRLADAMARIQAMIGSARNTMIESNSILEFLRPDFYAVVVDPASAGFKASALRYLDQADAILFTRVGSEADGLSMRFGDSIARVNVSPPRYHSIDLIGRVAMKLDGAAESKTRVIEGSE
jgi:hypothetical protein